MISDCGLHLGQNVQQKYPSFIQSKQYDLQKGPDNKWKKYTISQIYHYTFVIANFLHLQNLKPKII